MLLFLLVCRCDAIARAPTRAARKSPSSYPDAGGAEVVAGLLDAAAGPGQAVDGKVRDPNVFDEEASADRLCAGTRVVNYDWYDVSL